MNSVNNLFFNSFNLYTVEEKLPQWTTRDWLITSLIKIIKLDYWRQWLCLIMTTATTAFSNHLPFLVTTRTSNKNFSNIYPNNECAAVPVTTVLCCHKINHRLECMQWEPIFCWKVKQIIINWIKLQIKRKYKNWTQYNNLTELHWITDFCVWILIIFPLKDN